MEPPKVHQEGGHCRGRTNRDRHGQAGKCLLCAVVGVFLVPVPPLLARQPPPTVMAGTRLRVKFDSTVGTAISREGDGVTVQVIKPAEPQGSEVLPVGTILTGRVLFVRKGDTHKKVVPVLRLRFEQVRLPDGRTFPIMASLAGLGISEQVDSEGAAIPTQNTKTGNVAAAAGAAGVGAGVGAIAGGGSGAAKGAGIGGAAGVLGDLLTRNSDYWDFTLNRGRKAWLRLDADLVVADAAGSEPSSLRNPAVQAPPAPPTPAAPGPPAPARRGGVYLERTTEVGNRRVNVATLRQDISKAGVRLVEEPSEAVLSLTVWRDSHGFHGELRDNNGAMEWAGSAVTQSGFIRAVARFARDHGLLEGNDPDTRPAARGPGGHTPR
jgi:hypothetical protein